MDITKDLTTPDAQAQRAAADRYRARGVRIAELLSKQRVSLTKDFTRLQWRQVERARIAVLARRVGVGIASTGAVSLTKPFRQYDWTKPALTGAAA